jgi:hypothetical protein
VKLTPCFTLNQVRSPEEADKLFQSLRLFVGESEEGYEGAIHELSFWRCQPNIPDSQLLEFKYQREKLAMANFLLIEEPEASSAHIQSCSIASHIAMRRSLHHALNSHLRSQ